MFYHYCPPDVTRESILADMKALPPRTTYEDKYYIGYFDREKLVAVMDLILRYPNEETAFVGLFMREKGSQGQGIGSAIVEECFSFLGSIGYRFIRLGFAKGNPQSGAFWRKNGFTRTGVEADNENYVMVVMERGILLCRLLSFLSVCKVSAGTVPWRLHPKVFWLLSIKISLYGKFKSTLPSLKWK